MSDLQLSVQDVVVEPYAVSPCLLARLRVVEPSGEPVHALLLRCQVRIEPQRRRYDEEEAAGLADLFGGRERWAATLRPLLWMHTTAVVPGFTGATAADLPLPCSYDFEVSGARYLSALRDGEVPLVFLFSGTVFTRGSSGFTVTQVPWDRQATYRMPVAVWRDAMDRTFPHSQWLRLDRETVAALQRFKSERALPHWDDTVRVLLEQAASARSAVAGGR